MGITKININGEFVVKENASPYLYNRGLRYGDALFETMKVVQNAIWFWEDHYFRLMASMRILRMEIPMNFTMEFLEAEVLKTLEANALSEKPARVRFTVCRDGEGHYLPKTNTVWYAITAEPLESEVYALPENPYRADLYKDHYTNTGLLATLKIADKLLHVLGSIYAHENDYDTCLLLNHEKNVVEALNGNVFMVTGNQIKTPSLKDGCINGILRKQLLKMAPSLPGYTLEEQSIAPFELQQADELFITNVITGIRPVTHYRKKAYGIVVAQAFNKALQQFNVQA